MRNNYYDRHISCENLIILLFKLKCLSVSLVRTSLPNMGSYITRVMYLEDDSENTRIT
jgi:hypothetical protein